MSAFLQKFGDFYEISKNGSDPEIDQWPLMSSPFPVLAIVTAYATFVLYIGPTFMKNREPFNLKWIIIGYNLFQVFYSAYIVSLTLDSEHFWKYFFGFGCTRINPYEDEKFRTGFFRGFWLYVMAKAVDLIDTCFFVLRKKQSHISFLHVYHHIGTLLFSWSVLKYSIGQECLVIGLVNSFVHVVMYFYYFLAAFGPTFRRFLWWKRYLTVLQLAQFVYIVIHFMVSLVLSCSWNKFVVYAASINTVFHIFLFADFYQKAYRKRAAAEKAENAKKLE